MPRIFDRLISTTRCAALAAALPLTFAATQAAVAGEAIKIGTLMTTGGGALYIAQEKGYFAAEGLTAELVPFDAGQPVAVEGVTQELVSRPSAS